jgi:monoamine oxidase
MNKEKFRLSRRQFLKRTTESALAGSVLRAAAAMGIVSQSLGCGGSFSANTASTPTPGNPSQPTSNTSPRPIDWPNGVGSGKSVVILGAGIAGMSAAFEMNKLGYEVTILEAKARAGGRCQTIRAGDTVTETDSQQACLFDNDADLYFNPGPARIPHHHDLILGYCREFGVALQPFINDNQAALFHAQNAFGGQPQIACQIIAETRGYIADLLAEVIQQGNLGISLSAADQNNLQGMLQQFGELDSSFNYVSASRSGFIGQEAANSRQRGVPPAQHSLSELLASNFWQFQLDFAQSFDQQTTMLQPVGGMDQIARAFEQAVMDDIIYEAEVREIRKTSDGVNIVYQDAGGGSLSIAADYCICSIPATVLRQINNDFSTQHAAAIQSFVYTQTVKVAYQSRRFWEQEQSIYGGISWTDQDITQIWYPSHGFGQEQGILVGAYTFGQTHSQNLSNLPPALRISQVTTQAGRLHIQFTQEASRGISVAWRKVPFQLGAWGASSPGILTSADDNIFFAGEHLSLLQGWQEGAVLSAYNAIDQIVARDAG